MRRHHHHGPWRIPNPINAYVRHRLHRRLFLVFGATITVTMLLVSAMITINYHWRGGARINLAAPLFLVGCILWAASGKIARRLARPLSDLVRVAGEIGAGKLSARAELNCMVPDEVGILSEAINDMATRIQRQLEDQRALLAAVSHELRTPLGHLRLLLELGRNKGGDPATFEEMEKEIVEIDALVGELLASSRLDFTAIDPRPLQARELAQRALDRAGLGGEALSVEAAEQSLKGDPTLIARALANLLENAKRHGGGVTRLVVSNPRPGAIAFDVEDAGGGFLPGEADRVFEPFYRRPKPDGDATLGLGLGLSLVKRIAEAHGGSAHAGNREGGGARVGIEIATVS